MINLSSGIFNALYGPFFDRYLWHQFPGLAFALRDAPLDIVDSGYQFERAEGDSFGFFTNCHSWLLLRSS